MQLTSHLQLPMLLKAHKYNFSQMRLIIKDLINTYD